MRSEGIIFGGRATPAGLGRIAIQGERGSNSHMAALEMLGDVEVVPCGVSAEVMDAVLSGRVDAAVLPIENSLHGSVAEHYDLLLAHAVRIDAESLLRIRHNLIAAPGVRVGEIRTVLSHPVALSQCRKFLAEFMQAKTVPFYDTAGSVKHVMEAGLRDTAGVAPELAAREYGAEVLVAALEQLRDEGVDLTKIESRPVPGRPWEYVFYVELRYADEGMADRAVGSLTPYCGMVKELGRYAAA